MNDALYNAWRRDIACEYTVRTGRAFPRDEKRAKLAEFLVRLSDSENPPNPIQAVDMLIAEGLLMS